MNKALSVRPLATVKDSSLPWRTEGLLILVEHARGMLRWEPVNFGPEHPPHGGLGRALVLGETPLLFDENHDSPTCENLLALGMGRENVNPQILDALRRISNRVDALLPSTIEGLSPLLGLLEDGLYLVSHIPHFPTNGEGVPFWGLSRRPQPLKAAVEFCCFHNTMGGTWGYPAFLLPTQTFARCDWNRVEDYRQQIRAGSNVGALAFWADGFLSALLDGHHRATACLLENTPIDCLTVMSLGTIGRSNGSQSLVLWDERIPFESLPQEAVHLLETRARNRASSKNSTVSSRGEEEAEPWLTDPHWDALKRAAHRFPLLHGVVARALIHDDSDDHVESLFRDHENGADKLRVMLQGMIASRDPRAVNLALRIASSFWPGLWAEAFEFLATVRTQEVEAFFIDFLVREEGAHPDLEKIASAYFAGGASRSVES